MKHLLAAAALCVMTSAPVQAKQVYAGSEAAALRCAAILVVVPSALYNNGYISRRQVTVFQLASTAILTRYVGGNERQKLKAFDTMTKRRDASAHIKDFQVNAKTCLRQFPI